MAPPRLSKPSKKVLPHINGTDFLVPRGYRENRAQHERGHRVSKLRNGNSPARKELEGQAGQRFSQMLPPGALVAHAASYKLSQTALR